MKRRKMKIRATRKTRHSQVVEVPELDTVQAQRSMAVEQLMDRAPHVIPKPKLQGGWFNRVITFDTETWARKPAEPYRHYLTLGWATFHKVDRGYDSVKEGRDTVEFTEVGQFWDFVETKCILTEDLYVFAHNVAFDLRVVNFTVELENRGWRCRENFMPSPNGPFKLTYDLDLGGDRRKTIHFMDSGNYYGKRALADLGRVIGFEKEGVDPTADRFDPETCVPGTSEFKELSHYCRRDVDIIGKLLDYWVTFCRGLSLGPCAMTLAGQAFNAYRYRFMEHDIFIHCNVEVLQLEMDAMKGGLTDCFKRGRWEAGEGKQLHVLDVKSMYPFQMATKAVPTKLIQHLKGGAIGRDIAVGELSPSGRVDWVRQTIDSGYSVVSRVKVDTDQVTGDPRWKACLPVLHESRLLYATGQFETAVCGPELLEAMKRGIVADVVEVAVYDQDVIFRDYVEFFFAKRQEFKAAGEDIMQELCKLFLNSLFGKFGQCTHKWEATTEVQLEGDVTETFIDLDTEETYHYRQVGGLCEVRSAAKFPSKNSFIAISAFITAHARRYLRSMIEVAGFENVGYCDTDSIFTNDEGCHRLEEAGKLPRGRGAELGELEDELQCDMMELRTLKDYSCWSGGVKIKERLKGVKRGAETGTFVNGMFIAGEGAWYQMDQFEGIAGAWRGGFREGVEIRPVVKHPTHAYNKGVEVVEVAGLAAIMPKAL